jgi:uncharacterized pyridoxal phosphate-containing UPF0001 family protein
MGQMLKRYSVAHDWSYVQTNKVKFMAPFVNFHGVDSFKLLREINKRL